MARPGSTPTPRRRRRHASRRTRLLPWAIASTLSLVVLAAVAAMATGRVPDLRAQAVPEGLGRSASRAATGAATGASARPTTSVEPTASEPATVTFAAVGDLLFDLGPRSLIEAQGGAAPLAKVARLLRKPDVTIANLETTLSDRGASVLGKPAHLIFNGHPKGIASLTSAGIDLVSLANNHAMDHGRIALMDTIAALDKAGVGHAGAGKDSAAAWKPAIVTVRGRRIAYVTATQVLPAHFLAGEDRAGVANGDDMSHLRSVVRSAHKRSDIVIVSVHWGVEQSFTANAAQKRDARRLIDAGADVVLSHHPHVMQGIETYKGKLIAYSLGNFLFPYKTVEGRKSFVLRFEYGPKRVANITAVPVYLGEWGRPVRQTGASARSILGKLASISEPLGTRVTIKGDIGYITP